MLAPGTGVPLKEVKIKGASGKLDEVKSCFSGMVISKVLTHLYACIGVLPS